MSAGPAVPALVLAILALLWIAALPRIFFRPGRWNFQWWLNTAPFGVTGLVLLGALVGRVDVWAREGWLGEAMAAAAVVLLAAALGLMCYAIGTHGRPPALWHQHDDLPELLVAEGPYARIRHPLYTSYVVILIGCLLAAPHWINAVMLVFIAYRLNATAAREEGRFLASELGGAYAAYMRRTGRFVPSTVKRTA